jgi:succinate-semialdehyde dehydrogenase/glutarate-semialdehyde dehydrogenase
VAIATINPATGRTLKTFEPLGPAELELRLARAADAFGVWRATPITERARRMTRAAEILESERRPLSELMVTEMGKTIHAAEAETAKCALGCRFYAERAARFLADEEVATEAERSWVRYQPLGPVLAVMPWNFPFWQVFRFAAPGLMAGNVALLKHASNVPQCALAIEDVFRRAGMPEGVFQTLLIEAGQVEGVINDSRVAAVTLTGSTGAGRQVAAAAGRAIKKSVLELGGSDPFVVLPSADIARVAATAVTARTINNGQSCIAAKRFIVHDRVADEFEQRLVDGLRRLKVGDPMDPETELGPLATEAQLNTVAEQVERSVRMGARLLTGGRRIDRPGWFYEPTALAQIPSDSPAARDEVFGPVALLHRVRDLDEAIAVANSTPFGLGASGWTTDPRERDALIDRLEAGLVFINAMVASHPALPFGGVKQSGYGRELGPHGIREFVNVKSVWIGRAQNGGRPTHTE